MKLKIKVYSKTNEIKTLLVEIETKKLNALECFELIEDYLKPKNHEQILVEIETEKNK